MKIRLIGQANHTGIGIHYAAFCRALVASRPDLALDLVDAFDDSSCMRAVIESRPTDINICFVGTDMSRLRGRNIQWIPFESTRVPDMLIPALLDCHEIWAMTDWARSVLIDNGMPPGKIAVVPQGIDNHVWQPARYARPHSVKDFLLVGKCEQRKGIAETIQAWARTFKNDPSVRLTIKTHAGLQGQQGYTGLIDQMVQHGVENYRVIWGVMEDKEMVRLYQESDVFVLPTRAEGWGRPLIEAAAMGLPIITTRWSAHGEWLANIASSVAWVDHDLVALDDADFRQAYGHQDQWGQWAEPRVDSIAAALVQVRDDLDRWQQQARANARFIRQNYDWSQVVRHALDALKLT